MLAAFDPEPDPLTEYVVNAVKHLVGRGLTPEQAAKFLAVGLKLSVVVIQEMAGVEVTR